MSLVGFHKVLIGSAVLFCALFGGWQLLAAFEGGGMVPLLVGGGFVAAAVGLGYYLARLERFLGREERG